jgi:hypothetical protein
VTTLPFQLPTTVSLLDKYKTFDNNVELGQDAPSLDTLVYVTGEDVARPVKGGVTCIVFWGKYHAPCFKVSREEYHIKWR